ncbi:hypothetical protein KBD59_04660 [Candidatus Gracilibacteria bacterium]|nr:hypothetical protein [Candidatus Gracilibacteria bacterium]
MNIQDKNKTAFSSLEIIITISIIAVAFTFSMLFYQTSQLRADLNTQTALIISHVRLAQSNAASGATDQPMGIHFAADSFTTYIGPVYDPNSASNVVVTLPSTLTITAITLAGGGSNILFTSPQGQTVNSGSFTLYSSSLDTSNIITITSLGTIN